MIKSMTGYGVATTDSSSVKYTVEIKSLNSKFLELQLRLPKVFNEKEFFIRSECSKLIERGKVSLSINAEYVSTQARQGTINKELFKNYSDELKQACLENGLEKGDIAATIMALPGVISLQEEQLNEDEWNVVWNTLLQAFHSFDAFRQQEGMALQRDFELRIKNILDYLQEVETFEGKRIETVKDRLLKLLDENVEAGAVDKNRFEQELIYYLEKLDINEEKVRLRNHCDYLIKTMSSEASGKKISFILQEIGREINTMGSKSSEAQMQRIVVCMKDELEKLKEQVLNIL